MTEKDIQMALFNYKCQWFKNGKRKIPLPVMIPNVFLFDWWESDLIFLSGSGYAHEYEIKLTWNDFLADRRKRKKHKILAGDIGGPSEFYYVCPYGMIGTHYLPSYAGLIEVRKIDGKYIASLIVKGTHRKVEKLDNLEIVSLLKKGTNRYWKLLYQQIANPRMKE